MLRNSEETRGEEGRREEQQHYKTEHNTDVLQNTVQVVRWVAAGGTDTAGRSLFIQFAIGPTMPLSLVVMLISPAHHKTFCK